MPLELCHVCGNRAIPGDQWRSLGWERGPEDMPLVYTIEHAIELGEVEADENGVPRRSGITRLLRRLYGHSYKRAPLYRWAWRRLIGEYFYASVLGVRIAHDELTPEAPKTKS